MVPGGLKNKFERQWGIVAEAEPCPLAAGY